ncbi:MAG: hypothetical protein R3B09_18480 [Nannocystaceae bacterium]
MAAPGKAPIHCGGVLPSTQAKRGSPTRILPVSRPSTKKAIADGLHSTA